MAKKSKTCSVDWCNSKAFRRGWCVKHYRELRDVGSCIVDGCDKKRITSKYCGSHAQRMLRHGDPNGGKHPFSTEEKLEWIRKLIDANETDKCISWPFNYRHDGRSGYVFFEGRQQLAHRVVCIISHGNPPTPKHETAHSCGNGHLGCVNPRHLRWATHSENMLDKVQHGTHRCGENINSAKLSDEHILEIRQLAKTHIHREIAEMYGVGRRTVDKIVRRETWAHIE